MFFLKLLHEIIDSTGHGVCIVIYNIVSHNFQFPFRFECITLFVYAR